MEIKLSKAQQEVVDSIAGNICVNATAGSGKTTAIVARIQNLIVNHNVSPQSILAITFSKEAKENLQTKISAVLGVASVGVEIKTFHGLAYSILLKKQGFTSLNTMNCAERNKYLREAGVYRYVDPIALGEFIAQAKTEILSPDDDIEKFSHISSDYKELYDAYELYEHFKETDSQIEFDDYVNLAIKYLQENPMLLQYYKNLYKYIMVDEYQDINENQNQFIELLSSGDNLLVVGDAFQAIYGFRGGRSSYLTKFRKNHALSQLISMNENRRCTDKIVAAANKISETISDSHSPDYISAVAIHTSDAIPVYHECKNEADEAAYILSDIKNNSYSYNDVCILARTNGQLQTILSLFAQQGISVYSKDDKTFLDSLEIKIIISYINLANNPKDNDAFEVIYNRPNRYLGKKFFDKVKKTAEEKHLSYYQAAVFLEKNGKWRFSKGIVDLRNTITKIQKKKLKSYRPLVAGIRRDLKIDDYILSQKGNEKNSDNALENLDSFQDLCGDITTYKEFQKFLRAVANSKCSDFNRSAKIMTIHKSKGLGVKHVYILGCSDGLLPHCRSTDEDEERKIMYVGITRAEKTLHFTRAKKYLSKQTRESEFIKDLENTIIRK